MFSNQSGLNMDTILNSFLPHGIAQNQAPTSLWHSQWTWRRPQLNMKALRGLTDRKYKCILTGFLQGLWTRQQPQKPHGQCLPQNHLVGEALENGNRLNLRRWTSWFSYERKCWTGELIYLHWESAVEAHLWGLCIPQKHTQSPHLRRIIFERVKLWKWKIWHHNTPLKSSDLKTPPELILSSRMLRTWQFQIRSQGWRLQLVSISNVKCYGLHIARSPPSNECKMQHLTAGLKLTISKGSSAAHLPSSKEA